MWREMSWYTARCVDAAGQEFTDDVERPYQNVLDHPVEPTINGRQSAPNEIHTGAIPLVASYLPLALIPRTIIEFNRCKFRCNSVQT